MERVRREGWILVSVVVAVVVAVALGLGALGAVVFGGLAVLNSAGVKIYCDHLRSRGPALQRGLRTLAVLQMPVGFITVFVTPAGLTPSESATGGSPDELIRDGSAGFGPDARSGMG